MAESEYKNVWTYGPYLIARHRVAQFPARCLICGDKNGCQPLSCTLRKRPGIIQILSWPLGIFSPSVLIKPFLCPEHRGQELRSRWVGHSLLALAIAMMTIPFIFWFAVGDLSETSGLTFVTGALLAWAWVYYRIFRRRIIYAEHIKQRDAWIDGVHQSIMDKITALPYPAAE